MSNAASLHAAIHEEVALQAYDASWPSRFAAERERLLALFPGRFIAIEHMGSTAVPGLAAKPVIDMLAGVAAMEQAHALAGPLCAAGYTTSVAFNATLVDRRGPLPNSRRARRGFCGMSREAQNPRQG